MCFLIWYIFIVRVNSKSLKIWFYLIKILKLVQDDKTKFYVKLVRLVFILLDLFHAWIFKKMDVYKWYGKWKFVENS